MAYREYTLPKIQKTMSLISQTNNQYCPKNIVMCCDGTANQYALDSAEGLRKAREKSPDTDGDMNTNVVKLFGLLEKSTPKEQIAYYDPGVGTWGNRLTRRFSQSIGYGISENIKEAYRYLMDRYTKGDKIYLFGFSRGAYTVRSLAGFINKCGLLTRGSENLVDYAFQLYTTSGNEDVAEGFKKTYGRRCEVYFVGVWDTVAALAPPFIYHAFHDTKLNPNVRFAYHALSLDEMRKSFEPTLWDTPQIRTELSAEDREAMSNTSTWEAEREHQSLQREVEQVWFPGVHSDVGGSYRDAGLSDISLQWMLQKASNAGLIYNEKPLFERGIDPMSYDSNTEKNGLIIGKIQPNILGTIHDETQYFPFNLLPKQARIPQKGEIHPSAYDREKAVGSYKVNNPNQLKMYEG